MKFGIENFGEITREKIEAALELIRPDIPPTRCEIVPDFSPLGEVWAKWENENPTGAFKVRGGLVYFDWLKSAHPEIKTIVTATRGNHGQSVAFAARKAGIHARIIVPSGNSISKNEAMKQLGADLIEHGRDFSDALDFARAEAAADPACHFVPSFDWKLVLGVSTYGYELFETVPDLDVVFVPIGLGSGICGTIAARNALGCQAKIVGVVAEEAPTYADSFAAGRIVEGQKIPRTIADGVACRVPHPDAFEVIREHVDRILVIPEPAIEATVRRVLRKTGQRIEGAAALSFAALSGWMQPNQKAAVIVSGGNIDDEIFDRVAR
ncbi:MAG: threonine dehydratase [Verrucomicrobiales bacterium]|nr:threonine dehydratase [Verrucomicrobiales bacterium]